MSNPKKRQQWIYNFLKNEPNISHGECFGKYSAFFGKTERTFDKDWKIAKEQFKIYQLKVNKAKEEESIKKEVENVKLGLKTKIDRILVYQAQIDKINRILLGEENATFIINNKVVYSIQKGIFVLPIQIQTTLLKSLKELQSEISKIEGDYEKDNEQKNIVIQQITGMEIK